MEENDIEIDIDNDCEDNDPYIDMIGDITDVFVNFGGKYTFPTIDIYVEVRNYR